jgi:hypothetical protein
MRKALLMFLLAVPVTLFAQDSDWRNRPVGPAAHNPWMDNKFELMPLIGYRWGGTITADASNLYPFDVDVAGHMNYGFNFAIPVGIPGWKVELGVDRQDSHFTEGGGLFSPGGNLGKFSVTYYQASILVPFAQSRNMTPFFTFGGGIANLDPDVKNASSDNRFGLSGSIGVKIPLNPHAGIRLEGKGFWTFLGDDANSNCHCHYYYGYSNDLWQGETNVALYFRF